MKKLTLICINILLITIVACKKTTTNPQRTNNTVQSTDYSGTYVNSNNNSDYIKLSNTTNDNQNHKRYHIDSWQYNHCSYCNSGTGLNQDTVLESTLNTYPGWTVYTNNNSHPTSPDYGTVQYTNNTIKFNQYDGLNSNLIQSITYNKQ